MLYKFLTFDDDAVFPCNRSGSPLIGSGNLGTVKYRLRGWLTVSALSERRLRFRLRRGNFEVELEGDFDYVRGKFEELLRSQPAIQSAQAPVMSDQSLEGFVPSDELTGILETTPDGKLHFTIPFDRISAKEAIGLLLYSSNPSPLEDAKLIELLGTSWKAVKDNVVRARVSELRKEGKLIAEQGRYSLSGAGLQWVGQDVVPKLRPASPTST